MTEARYIVGDTRDVTASLPDGSVDLGRDAIGADLDERNAELARERCGMFLTVDHLGQVAS